MDLIPFGWREGILVFVLLAAVYLVLMLVRLTRVGRRRPQAEQAEQVEPSPAVQQASEPPLRQETFSEPVMRPNDAVSAYETAAQIAPGAVTSAPTFEWDDIRELFGEDSPDAAPAAAAKADPAVPPPRRGGFGEALSEHLARSDMETEMQRMRDEMESMRHELEELRSARRVSPQYAEAMELSQRGLTAQDVADRLGISLGEAELVHALSRSETDFDQGEDDGAEGNAGGIVEFGHRRIVRR